METLKTTNIIKITGFLLSSLLFNSAIAGGLGFASLSDLTPDAQQIITIQTIESTGSAIPSTAPNGAANVGISVGLIGLELNGTIADIGGSLLDNFTVSYTPGAFPVVRFEQKNPEYPGGAGLTVTIPVSVTATSGEVSYTVVADKQDAETAVAIPPIGGAFSGAPATITGGATSPNYAVNITIGKDNNNDDVGNDLGTDPSKMLPLEITVTNNTSFANTGPVVVALAKDSRITSVDSNCGGTDWNLDSTTNSVAYLFTYTANSNAFPAIASEASTIVCPVTVTRPTTQSGKLQLNAVLRHGSGDTKTSNDVASIEVTYN